MILVALLLAIAVTLVVPPAAAQNCTTRWNPVFRQYETSCTDGSRREDRYNPVFRQWDSTITPPTITPPPPLQPLQPQNCTTRWNPVFRQWDSTCR
jgi:hypothetical protein